MAKWNAKVKMEPKGTEPIQAELSVEASTMVGAVGRAAREAFKQETKGKPKRRWLALTVEVEKALD